MSQTLFAFFDNASNKPVPLWFSDKGKPCQLTIEAIFKAAKILDGSRCNFAKLVWSSNGGYIFCDLYPDSARNGWFAIPQESTLRELTLVVVKGASKGQRALPFPSETAAKDCLNTYEQGWIKEDPYWSNEGTDDWCIIDLANLALFFVPELPLIISRHPSFRQISDAFDEYLRDETKLKQAKDQITVLGTFEEHHSDGHVVIRSQEYKIPRGTCEDARKQVFQKLGEASESRNRRIVLGPIDDPDFT